MVAVKMLWVLWKSFSTNFSFSNGSVNPNNGYSSSGGSSTSDQKSVRYNRLKNQSRSYPANLCSGGGSKPKMSNSASYDTNGNRMITTNSSSTEVKSGESIAAAGSSGIMETEWRHDFDSDSDCEDEDLTTVTANGRGGHATGDESSDFDDEEEGLICEVCDRTFSSGKKLRDHQEKKRHFGCLQCDSIFPNRETLDRHREQMDHYDYVSDYGSDTTSYSEDDEEDGIIDDKEERERLL